MTAVRLAVCVATLLSATPALAQTTRVVDDDGLASAASCDDSAASFARIGDAISAAVNGDSVLVCPGTYVENVNFGGKAVIVRSVAGAVATIIDGGAADSVVRFISSEGAGSVLEGFTIRNGSAGLNGGGGIRISNASPVIRGNDIVANRACRGGGLYADFASPLIEGNTIRENRAFCDGGAIEIGGAAHAIVRGNLIANNVASSDGGGIGMFAAGDPIIERNVFSGNRAVGNGGAMSMVNRSDAEIAGNLIAGNRAPKGGGIYWGVPSGNRGPRVVNNTIVNNDGVSGSGVFADAYDANAALYNNTIVALAGQDAVFCGNSNDLNPPLFRNNNVFSATGLPYAGICVNQTGANGNLSADPLFVNPAEGNYHLRPGSPNIDAGNDTAPSLPLVDSDGEPRRMGDRGGASVVDIGADEVAGPRAVTIDGPRGLAGATFVVSGWAIDARGVGTGIDAVHVWAYPDAGAPRFVGAATYGVSRPDVAAAFGDPRLTPSGFTLSVPAALPPGSYTLVAYGHSKITGAFETADSARITVASQPVLAVDAPGAGVTIGTRFRVSGWALDRASGAGPGVDAVHCYAFPLNGDAPLFLGAATMSADRPDVASIFGAQFAASGWLLDATLPPGDYQIGVYARSTVAGSFNAVETRLVHVVSQSRPVAAIDVPQPNATPGQPFTIAGWAVDLGASSGTGLDVVSIFAQPLAPFGSEIFLGSAVYGAPRPDVAAALGSNQFAASGFSLTVTGLAPGTYRLWVLGRSTVEVSFPRIQSVDITIQ